MGRESRAQTAQPPGLWRDGRAAQPLLRALVGLEAPGTQIDDVNLDALARWLVDSGLAALAYRRSKGPWAPLGERLRAEYYITAMNHTLHMRRLADIASRFTNEGVPFVLLKGVALSQAVYADHVRPMSDIDLWLRAADLPLAMQVMSEAGYRFQATAERPLALQAMSSGELRFVSPDEALVELHWSPYAGWWLKRAARVDDRALWERIEPLELNLWEEMGQDKAGGVETSYLSYTLGTEDMLLHLAVHLAVNHQFGVWGIRSIVDMAMVMARRNVDWKTLVARARRWRLATVLWTVLDLEQQLVGTVDLEPVLGALQPARWKRMLLARLIDPGFLLGLESRGRSPTRFVLLLLLTDRLVDSAGLIFLTLWPEREWLEARYGTDSVSRWQHLWNILRRRDV